MPIKFLSASVALAMVLATPVFAQTPNDTCNNGHGVINHSKQLRTNKTAMTGTSSAINDYHTVPNTAGNALGNSNNSGVISPCPANGSGVPSGAVPNSLPNSP